MNKQLAEKIRVLVAEGRLTLREALAFEIGLRVAAEHGGDVQLHFGTFGDELIEEATKEAQ